MKENLNELIFMNKLENEIQADLKALEAMLV